MLFNKTRQYIIFILKLSFSSIGQDKSKLQNQISKLLILKEIFSQADISIKINNLFIYFCSFDRVAHEVMEGILFHYLNVP